MKKILSEQPIKAGLKLDLDNNSKNQLKHIQKQELFEWQTSKFCFKTGSNLD